MDIKKELKNNTCKKCEQYIGCRITINDYCEYQHCYLYGIYDEIKNSSCINFQEKKIFCVRKIYDFKKSNICPICDRIVPVECWEKHHLIPKCYGGKDILYVCVECGNAIHKLISLNQLKETYNTVETLRINNKLHEWKLSVKDKEIKKHENR